MLITHKKEFSIGMVLTLVFLAVLWFMFTDHFGGTNAFHASDALFNSISKGSTYYVPQVREGAVEFDGQQYSVQVMDKNPQLVPDTVKLLEANGISVNQNGEGLTVSGELRRLFDAVIRDSDAMFKNDGTLLETRYGMDPRESMYLWWMFLKSMKQNLDEQKKFAVGAYIDKMLIQRAVEVGYNYYGIEAQDASEDAGIITFALVFYVVYTMWWGYSVFFLFEGFGLEMKAGKKKEM